MFDLINYQINIAGGTDAGSLPGVFAFLPAKRAARGRETDKLFGFLKFLDPRSISADLIQQWINAAAARFYQTPGTVTSAMRMVTDYLNNQIMDRNLRGNEAGKVQATASLNLAVEHHGFLYHTTLGSTRTFLVQANFVDLIVDNEATGKGLGVSRLFVPRFQQAELTAGDLLLFSTNPPLSWTVTSLAGSTTLSTDALGRRLFNQVGSELQAVVFHFTEGSGKIERKSFRPSLPTVQQMVKPIEENKTPIPVQPIPTPAEKRVSAAAEESVVVKPAAVTPQPAVQMRGDEKAATSSSDTAPVALPKAQEQPEIRPSRPVQTQSGSTDRSSISQVKQPTKTANTPVRASQPSEFSKDAAAFLGNARKAQSKFRTWFAGVLRRILPGVSDASPHLSRSLMLIISIAVPLVVVTIGATVFNRMGRTQELEAYFTQAQASVVQADNQANDASAQLASLQQAMFWLEKADQAGGSDEVDALKSEVQSRLDSINGIRRLKMTSALSEVLPESVKITRLLTVGNDLYALDSTTGKAMHFILSGGTYQKDVNFDCGPNEQIAGSIGPLVDITPLDGGAQFGATILGIDASGMLEYCVPSDTGNITQLTLPDAGWGKIQALTLSQGTLYVLDTKGNAVYMYEGSGVDFPDKPVLFFDNQVPTLTEALDIAVNGDELYILRSNGEMVECTYSYLKALKSTECQDPAPYGDMRTGQLSQTTVFANTQFTQLEITQAPDSSLYMLDITGKTLYHFSLQRNLQNVYTPTLGDGLDIKRMTPTAFTISNNRVVFMAFGNEVQMVSLP